MSRRTKQQAVSAFLRPTTLVRTETAQWQMTRRTSVFHVPSRLKCIRSRRAPTVRNAHVRQSVQLLTSMARPIPSATKKGWLLTPTSVAFHKMRTSALGQRRFFDDRCGCAGFASRVRVIMKSRASVRCFLWPKGKRSSLSLYRSSYGSRNLFVLLWS